MSLNLVSPYLYWGRKAPSMVKFHDFFFWFLPLTFLFSNSCLPSGFTFLLAELYLFLLKSTADSKFSQSSSKFFFILPLFWKECLPSPKFEVDYYFPLGLWSVWKCFPVTRSLWDQGADATRASSKQEMEKICWALNPCPFQKDFLLLAS